MKKGCNFAVRFKTKYPDGEMKKCSLKDWSKCSSKYPRLIINLVNFFLVIVTLNKIKFSFYNGEFDPGSGLTLAAGLIHASRTAAGPAMDAGEWRTGA